MCWAPARLEKRGDPPRTPLPVSVGCTSARACPSQRECSQRRRWLRTRHWRASGSQRGLTYLSLGAGGLFSDLMVLAGLLARGVRVSTVVLIDTIYEELLAAFQSPSAPPEPTTFAASGGSMVEKDPSTGLVRLTLPWRRSPATERPSCDPCEVRGAARCRQCQDAASLVPMPPAHGLVVVDLVANFCGWLSLAAPRMQDQRL